MLSGGMFVVVALAADDFSVLYPGWSGSWLGGWWGIRSAICWRRDTLRNDVGIGLGSFVAFHNRRHGCIAASSALVNILLALQHPR